MPRLLGVDIPNEKRIDVALQYLYGVGPAVAKKCLDELAINPTVRAKDLKDDEVANIAGYLESNFPVEGALRRLNMQNIQRLKEIYCYRGLRHRRGCRLAPAPITLAPLLATTLWSEERSRGRDRGLHCLHSSAFWFVPVC